MRLDRRTLIAGLSAALLAPRFARAAPVTDAGGRAVPVPAKVMRVFPGGPPAAEIYQALKERKIPLRLMRYPGLPDGLRITVGTDPEIDPLLEELVPLVRVASSGPG